MTVAILAIAAIVGTTQELPDCTGWSLARWGMTTQQVRESFPAARAVDPPVKDLGTLIRLQAYPVQLSTYKARAQFAFPPDQDRLTAVSVTVTQDTPRTSAFDALKQALVEKYGKPTSSDSTTEGTALGSAITTRTVIWRLRSSMVTLEWIEGGDVGSVGVRYAERKPDPTI